MTARMLLAWTATIGVAASSVGLTASSFAHDRAIGKQSAARLSRCQSDAERARQLRAALPARLTHTQDASPLGPRLHKVLAGVNLAASVLTNVAPQTGASVPLRWQAGGGGLGERPDQLTLERVGIKLEPLTLPELGTFLKAWQAAEPCWNISAIDVTPILPDRNATPPPGSDLPVRASMTLESLTLKSNRGGR